MHARLLPSLAASCLLLGFLAGCAEPDPEEELREASRAVAERQGVVDRARLELEEREKALAEAQAERDRAQQGLRDAERRLDAARQEVAKYASDDVLFRAVQRRLLEDESLEGVAVSAEVQGRVVTLRGNVESEEQRDRAIALARETAGVDGVQSRLRVSGTPSEGKAKPAPGPAAGASPPPAKKPAPERKAAPPEPGSKEKGV